MTLQLSELHEINGHNLTTMDSAGPKGIGGWLLLLAMLMVWQVIASGNSVFGSILVLLEAPSTEPVIVLFVDGTCLLWLAIVCYMFGRGSRRFPITMIAYVMYVSLLPFIGMIMPVPYDLQLSSPDVVIVIINQSIHVVSIVPYLLYSKRVKNTFVR